MRNSKRGMTLAAAWLAAVVSNGDSGSPVFAAGQTAEEPLSKAYRITRARDVEFQKIEPFKVFDNLYYVGPGYVSVWLLTTPEGHILFDSAQEPYVDHVILSIRKVGVDPRSIKYIILSHGHLDHFGGAARDSGSLGRARRRSRRGLEDDRAGGQPSGSGWWTTAARAEERHGGQGTRHADPGRPDAHIPSDPGHTPGVLTTEGITLHDGGAPL